MTRPPEWFDHLAEGVVLHEHGDVTAVNRAAARLLDVEQGRASGRPLINVLRDHRLEAAVDRHGATVELELRGRHVIATALEGALLLRDVTEAAGAREQSRELLAIVSHELRTPVAAIAAVLDALATDVPPATRERFSVRAREEAQRLARLVSDLTLDVRPPRARTLALDEVVDRAVQITRTVREPRGVDVEYGPSGLTVWVDEDKLLQALVNLIENAALHGPRDSKVTVAASAKGDMAVVEVIDVGEPLTEGVHGRLFELRAEGGPRSKGTGLGLYIVRSVAEGWGGEAWGRAVRSGDGGNAFGFVVPLHRPYG